MNLFRNRLKEENTRLFCKVIMLNIELETIAENPESDRAKKIITKYKLKVDRRREQDLAEQN